MKTFVCQIRSARSIKLRKARKADANERNHPICVESANPRLVRLVRALLLGPLWREDADRAAGCSNSPDLILHIRRLGPGRENLVCIREKVMDRDGVVSYPGRYHLSLLGQALLTTWLNSQKMGAAYD